MLFHGHVGKKTKNSYGIIWSDQSTDKYNKQLNKDIQTMYILQCYFWEQVQYCYLNIQCCIVSNKKSSFAPFLHIIKVVQHCDNPETKIQIF